MIVDDEYIEPDLPLDTAINHVALEAAIRAIEDDPEVIRYNEGSFIDIRALSDVASVEHLRDLIRCDEFELDLQVRYVANKKSPHPATPYGRTVKRAFMTNHPMVESAKGWLVFDTFVTTTTVTHR